MVNKFVSNLSIAISLIILLSIFFVFPQTSFLRPSLPFSKVNNIDIHSPLFRIELVLIDHKGKEFFNDNFFSFKKNILNSHSAKITFYYAVILMQFSSRSDLYDIVQRYICTNNQENPSIANLKYSNEVFQKTVVIACN